MPGIRTIDRLHPPDEATRRAQDRLVTALNALSRSPIVNGRLITGLELELGSELAVSHGLGRAPLGWFVVGKNTSADVWESTDRSPWKLFISAGADVTLDLWVF